ncbi:MAG: HD domain-containing phosphohydrolase [Gaiellaceae bacterium]
MRRLETIALAAAIALVPVSVGVALTAGERSLADTLIPAGLAVASTAILLFLLLADRTRTRRSAGPAIDPLTNLGTHQRLAADFEKRLARLDPEDRLLLALFDLRGFKDYNDSFGRRAGDALLARLGRKLDAAALGDVYRTDGDEFCLVAELRGRPPEDVVWLAGDALGEQGEAFSIEAASGCVLLPEEARELGAALHLASHRLYSGSSREARSPGRQSADVLLQAMRERSPEIVNHPVDVIALAVEVGQQLGMPREDLGELRQAAELHDVGKMAIPDAILMKPGPLDHEEWEFVRGHTVVGERILSAAPALAQLSRWVRSTHERWDGGGYPDGLPGPSIPLASRIIAVCDAYDAMIGPRPYRLGMGREDAIAELGRCSGSQFDPDVVACFTTLARLRDPEEAARY